MKINADRGKEIGDKCQRKTNRSGKQTGAENKLERKTNRSGKQTGAERCNIQERKAKSGKEIEGRENVRINTKLNSETTNIE